MNLPPVNLPSMNAHCPPGKPGSVPGPAAGSELLERIIDGRRIWRGSESSLTARSGLPTGHNDLDELLCGGWPQGGLTEILTDQEGMGALGICMPALARLSQGRHWLAWVAPPYIPYAPALAHWGVRVGSVLWVHSRPQRDTLWALEQALRSGTCAAVLGWLPAVESAQLRRLQLAAEAGDTLGLLFRPSHAAANPSPASLRLRMVPYHEGMEVQVIKQRGQWPARSLRIHRERLAGPEPQCPPLLPTQSGDHRDH